MKTQATSVRTQCKSPHGFPSFSQKATTVGARALWSRWRRHVRRKKKSAQMLEKHFFCSRTQCTKPSSGGPSTKQALPTSCATPPTEQAPQSGTVAGCCAVSCFDLPSSLFYDAVLLGDICEPFFVLCYSEYSIFVYVYASPPYLFT